jgi:hypothetical protein
LEAPLEAESMRALTLAAFALLACMPVFASFKPTICKDIKCAKIDDKTVVHVKSVSKER